MNTANREPSEDQARWAQQAADRLVSGGEPPEDWDYSDHPRRPSIFDSDYEPDVPGEMDDVFIRLGVRGL